MRWTLCALLLLSLCPARAFAAPTIVSTTPKDSDVFGTPEVDDFTKTKTVSATVTGTPPITVTVTVNGSAPFPATVQDPNFPNLYTANDLPFPPTTDPLVIPNSTIVITASDSTVGTDTETLTVTFDDQPPVVSAVTIVTPPAEALPDPNTTGFASIRIAGSMTDNDPNFTHTVTRGGTASLLLDPNTDTYSQRVILGGGANTVIVRARDRAGNEVRGLWPMEADPNSLTIERTFHCKDPTFPVVGVEADVKTFVVDRSDDLADAVLDGVCDVRPDLRPDPDPNTPGPFDPPFGHCTLRAAIQEANHRDGDDRIQLGFKLIRLTRKGADPAGGVDDKLGDLDITDNLQIVGAGRDVAVIDGRKLGDRVFDVHDGKELQLMRLTVSGGQPKAQDPNDVPDGGCIRTGGTLRTNTVAIVDCKSPAAGGAVAITDAELARLTCSVVARGKAKTDGGGVLLRDTPLELFNSTLALNSAGGRGGAISMRGDGDTHLLTMGNVTVSKNKAKAGGALDLGLGVSATANNCTFADNAAKAGSTLSTTDNATATVSNSIFGDKAKTACDPSSPEPLVSGGGNIDRGSSCLTSTTQDDQPNTDPKLTRLATNFGPPTQAPAVTSPAIDRAGRFTRCEPIDARDVERSDWPREDPNQPDEDEYPLFPKFCDAGALELFVPADP